MRRPLIYIWVPVPCSLPLFAVCAFLYSSFQLFFSSFCSLISFDGFPRIELVSTRPMLYEHARGSALVACCSLPPFRIPCPVQRARHRGPSPFRVTLVILQLVANRSRVHHGACRAPARSSIDYPRDLIAGADLYTRAPCETRSDLIIFYGILSRLD